MLLRRKNKIYIIITILSFLLFFFIYFSIKTNRCYQISNNFSNFVKLAFNCSNVKSITIGQYIYSIQHQFSDYFRFRSLLNKRESKCGKEKKLILLIGQSNAANEVRSFKYKINNNLNLYNNNCYILSNPVLGTTGHKDNISIAISNYLKNQNYIFITSAWSGSSILDWGSDKFSYFSDYILKQLNYNSNKYKVDIIIWIQGETDFKLFKNLDIDQGPVFFQKYGKSKFYIESFKIMLNNFKPFLKDDTKIIITKTSKCDSGASNFINLQQTKIAQLSNNYYILENTDNLDNNYRYDNCHLNEMGVDTTARSIASIINSLN